MEDSSFVMIGEIFLKAEKDSGKTLILKETKEADVSLVMFVGEPEFLAIAKEKGLIQTPRPLTHELYLTILENLGIQFLRVEIYDLRDQAYIANIIYNYNGTEVAVDSRPSDALALALNRQIPILVHPKLLRREITSNQVETFKEFIKSVRF
jgi:uncharacterized protein